MKTAFVEKITAPVKPGEFMFALDVIGAVGDGNGPAHRFVHGLRALKSYFDEGKAGSLNSRVWAFRDMLHNEKVIEWKSGTKGVHPALFVAAAELPMNERASFHPDDFYGKVKEIATQNTAEDIRHMVEQERRGLPEPMPYVPEPQYLNDEPDWRVEQRVGVQRIGRNAPCPCGSGKKYKKCHGGN